MLRSGPTIRLTSESWQPENCYDTPYDAINNANRILDQIESGELPIGEDLKTSTLAELRAARALWYMMLLDTHGNVPIVTHFNDSIPQQATRKQVYDFVVSELTSVIPSLTENVDASTYGRLTKWGALTALARVYLNAEVYTGTPRWKECLDCCNHFRGTGNRSRHRSLRCERLPRSCCVVSGSTFIRSSPNRSAAIFTGMHSPSRSTTRPGSWCKWVSFRRSCARLSI